MPRFRNEGPQVWVVELQRHVKNGEECTGSDKLAAAHGFVLVEKPAKADKPKDED